MSVHGMLGLQNSSQCNTILYEEHVRRYHQYISNDDLICLFVMFFLQRGLRGCKGWKQ